MIHRAESAKYFLYIFPALSTSRLVYNKPTLCERLDGMMDEKEAWNAFLRSGSVRDYLEYKAIQNKNNCSLPEAKDEVQNQGSDTQTTEYR